MDFFGIRRGSIRANALEKIAVLSLTSTKESDIFIEKHLTNGYTNGSAHDNVPRSVGISGDLLRLANAISSDVSQIPITHKELEIIFALTKASDHVKTHQQALDLLAVLSPYFLESPFQQFKSNVSLQLSPSPWDHLTHSLSTAIIQLSKNFPQLIHQSYALFEKYLIKFENNLDLKISSYFSLLGFLKALVDSHHIFKPEFVNQIFSLFDRDFLDHIESITSRGLEEEHEYGYLLAYKATGDEFNSLLFTKLIQEFSNGTLLAILSPSAKISSISNLVEFFLETLTSDYEKDPEEPAQLDEVKNVLTQNYSLLEILVQRADQQINELDYGGTYINLSTNERINLAFETKSLALEILGAGLLVDVISNEHIADIVNKSLSHETEIFDQKLIANIISLGSLLSFKGYKNLSGVLIHTFPLIVSSSSSSIDREYIRRISRNLAYGFKPLTQDSIITTIYSLVNLLSVNTNGEPSGTFRDLKLRSARSTSNSYSKYTRVSRANTIQSLSLNHSFSTVNLNEYTDKVLFKHAIESLVEIAKRFNDPDIIVLTVTVLSQKFRKVSKELDRDLLEGLSNIATILSEKEFLTLTKLYDIALENALNTNDEQFVESIQEARVSISRSLEGKQENPLYYSYLNELLNNTISRGDVQTSDHHRSHGEISEVARQISLFLKPLATLLPKDNALVLNETDIDTINSFRNFWFNLVVHGYNETSQLTKTFQKELEIIAFNSPPLASEYPRSYTETSFELNTVLRRGSSNHNLKDQKHIISGVSNTNALELRTLSYPKLMFLSATSLLEGLRVNIGDCSTILNYFSDPSIAKANVEKFIGYIVISSVGKFVKLTAKGNNEHFTSDKIANQLTKILIFCCHRNYDLQDAAFQATTLFLSKLPSSLCHRQSLFTLLDILTLLFDSIVDSGRNKYQPQREFQLKHFDIKITLSDSSSWRRSTLEKLHKKAKEWCLLSLSKSNQDMKSLLQSYISDLGLFQRLNGVELGVSFAVELAGKILPTDLELSNIPSTHLDKPDSIAGFLSQYSWRAKNIAENAPVVASISLLEKKNTKMKIIQDDLKLGKIVLEQDLIEVLDLIATLLILRENEENNAGLIHELVSLPFEVFTSNSMKVATNIWLGIIKERQDDLAYVILAEIVIGWQKSIKREKGLFSKEFDLKDEALLKMTYSPSNGDELRFYSETVTKNIQTHLHVIKLFSSHFQGTLFESDHLLKTFTVAAVEGLKHLKYASLHPFARLIRSELIKFGSDVLQLHYRIGSSFSHTLSELVVDGVLSWFVGKSHYPSGGNNLKIKADLNLLIQIFEQIRKLPFESPKKELSLVFIRDEISKVMIWLSPVNPSEFKGEPAKATSELIKFAYHINPELAFGMIDRFPHLESSLESLITSNPIKTLGTNKSVKYLLKHPQLYKYLILAEPISPTDSIILFQTSDNPYITQYNMRSLESHDINLTFFYVPQIVQSLRNDKLGYVGRFIVETGAIDQLFAHQIIWNILANRFKDEEATIEDPLKPSLDFVMNEMISTFSEEDLVFYETEFKFFNEVTAISGKLKPFIKSTKAEKKLKIDEEMKQIVVAQNVYLPSNPDGVVVDINRSSGKPLQSHAKAPFMATFKIRKYEQVLGETLTIEKWQSAIFKVGDDCRQDVLALQLISIFKSIWENANLDLYCFPYRVTATAPGCGVIDVLPNSISRDMLGREAVNGLYEYFVSKFGNENSVEFENARNNFVKSLAAYSIISYLLQFKDRHNGNIMYDDQGHILHIDFGFCFDIVPGGVKFEAVPFKLTKEMVKVMGGSNETESFKMFEELFIKGFLSVRPYYDLIAGNVRPMLSSGLPCFKGEKTMKNLKNRFFLNKDDAEAISSIKGLVRRSYESMFTVGYDKFQKLTNGIPY